MPVSPVALNLSQRGQSTEFARRGPLHRRASAGLCILSVLVPSLLMAAEPPAGGIAPPPSAVTPVLGNSSAVTQEKKRIKPSATREQKRKVVVLTSIMMAGILTVLLLLFLWIVWWSRRTHRLLRAPLPAANRGDELWYLKTKRTPHLAPELPAQGGPPNPPAA